MRRALAILLRQWYLVRGSPPRLLPLFTWVMIDITLWGFITRWLDGVAAPGVRLVPTLLGAVLLWDFLQRVMQGVTMAFFEDVWSRNFLNVFASPLRIPEYLGGLVLSSMATSTVGLVAMLALATGAFGLDLGLFGATLVPAFLTVWIFGIALGIVGTAVVLRLGPAAEWFVWPIPAALSPFVGVFYPVATLPAWMQPIAHALPPSWVFETMRAVVAGRAPSGVALAIGGALAVVYLLSACAVFTLVHRYAVRTGLIARYAAESVS